MRLFLFFSLGSACLINTNPSSNADTPLPAVPICLFNSSILVTNASLEADDACLLSDNRPTCKDVVPLLGIPTCQQPVRGCASSMIITPSFRYSALQNTLEQAGVGSGMYWTLSDVTGSYKECGIADASYPFFFTNLASCYAPLPVICICYG